MNTQGYNASKMSQFRSQTVTQTHTNGPNEPLSLQVYDCKEAEDDSASSIRVHPLGVKPGGNALTSHGDLQSSAGLFGILPDELLLTLLEYLQERCLLQLGACCRGLFAFTTTDSLWKDLFIR